MTLPPNAAFQTIDGPSSRNSHLAKQLVCLEACKKLHQMGALDAHLLPSIEEPSEKDLIVKSKESGSGAGMYMNKLLANLFLIVRYGVHRKILLFQYFKGSLGYVILLKYMHLYLNLIQSRMQRKK
jgi:hypothetical protein